MVSGRAASGRAAAALRTVALASAGLALLAGCGSSVAGTARPLALTDRDRALVTDYFGKLNDAGAHGSAQQLDVLSRTQHPDFPGKTCDLAGMTLRIEPTMSTLRTDARWVPTDQAQHPRGVVYVVAVTVSARRDNAEVGSQIGSEHVVVLDGVAYGFAPCLSG
ncbi:hypothetical protein F0L68_18920 [Solihabitans fulvus]|uniref:Lipoprotein n=1 Tax=Solihabitans fulvus TaxID=1892852 RepID=A0A5B2XDC0_9PSEU|nr:hypothetical protein [Solihabitans fulvus]KAA2261029.1 hypothetical protein F0L68_18920 [Solihabitans fulvus]